MTVIDDIELSEQELLAYMNLQKAKKLIEIQNLPEEERAKIAKSILPSAKPILRSKEIEKKLQEIKVF